MKFIAGKTVLSATAESAVEYGWLAAGCGAYAGEAGGARNNLQHVAGITEAAKKPSRMRILSANILAMHGNG